MIETSLVPFLLQRLTAFKKSLLDLLTFHPKWGLSMSSVHSKMTIEEIEAAFEKDPNGTIKEIYAQYREQFVRFSRTYSKDHEMIVDCFQESIIALYENLVIGRINKKETTLKTYLFAIGKNKILKNQNKKSLRTTEITAKIEHDTLASQEDDISIYKEHLTKAFEHLGDKCKDVIVRFYYYKHTIQMIAEDLNYKNANTVKAHKSRCLAKLKDIVNQLNPAI